jgi:L-2,4-diaminobutyrate decarboxylase
MHAAREISVQAATFSNMTPRGHLDAAFAADRFRVLGHRVVDLLADHLARAHDRDASMPVLPSTAPHAMMERWPSRFDEEGGADLLELLGRVVAESNHLHHPRYVGHQVTAPLPDAALCDLVAALLNNSMAVYEMGPASTAMERSVIAWMARALGYPADAEGVLTSGGSIGNLTALIAARRAKGDAMASERLAVLTGAQTHYSVRRAVEVMGFGAEGVVVVPVDERFRLRVDALAEAHRTAEARGRRVIAVVASACSTATGAFDPLEPIAEHCAQHDLWLHVDGAHGASAILSPAHRHLLAGVGRADSVVWDAHKMMLMPSLVTAVLFRDGERSYEVFAQQASYLFGGKKARDEWFDTGLRTLECTKRMMALKVYAALAVHGPAFFAEYVTATFDRARRFAAMLAAAPDFEVAVEPQCNIVCFRVLRSGLAGPALDALQARVRTAIVAQGGFYLVQTGLPRGTFLRVTIINPLTTDEDLCALMLAIRAASLAID